MLLVGVGSLVWYGQWRQDAPRRECLESLTQLESALKAGTPALLQDLVQLPAALQSRTPTERTEFLAKALRDEISDEGLAVLKKQGRFGPLTSLFPAEATAWATQAGVKPEDCFAFRLDRTNAPRAEVVLLKPSTLNAQPSTAFRLVRVNNVTQPPPATKP